MFVVTLSKTSLKKLGLGAMCCALVVGCFCVYTAASLGRLMKNKPEEKAAKKKKKAKKE